MTLTLVSLTKALSKAAFDCGYPELNQFLRHNALKNGELSIGKTYVAVNEVDQLVGYVPISAAQIAAEALPEDIRSRLPAILFPPSASVSLQSIGVSKALARGDGF